MGASCTSCVLEMGGGEEDEVSGRKGAPGGGGREGAGEREDTGWEREGVPTGGVL